MKTTFLETDEDMKWLRETHLSDGSIANYSGDYTEFRSAIIHGNEDSPALIELYIASHAMIWDPPFIWKANAQ